MADITNPKPESCKACPLYDSTEGIVWGKGPINAKMMLVGEAPGEEEGAALMPFIGGSGRVLTALVNQAGITRSETYVTNAVKCRPTAKGVRGDRINRVPTDVEIRACAPLLLNEIRAVNPNTIIALGNIPMKVLTGSKHSIMYSRSVPTEGLKRSEQDIVRLEDGTVVADRYKVIGTFHPAFVMRSQDFWPVTVFDLARAKAESATPVISRRAWKSIIHAKLSDVGESLMRRIREPRLGGLRYYSHDLETTGLNPRTDTFRCIGIAAEPDEVFCFDWTSDVIEFVSKLHSDPGLITVGQNSEGFDIWFQEEKGFKFEGPSYDTMIGFHLLNSSLPKDLGFIGACVTDEKYWKDDTMYKAGEDALQAGCNKDVHATARAFEDQYKELEQLGQVDLYFNHIAPLQPVLRNMTRRGVKKDLNVAGSWHKVLNRKTFELEEKLKRAMGDPNLNVRSPKQLMDLLYTRMGLPIQYKKTREGYKPSVDAESLDALANISNNPILLLIRDIRTLGMWDSTFIMCPHDENGFIHGHFGSAKAANGRLNAFDPNLQNFPLQIREIVVPDTADHILISRDWNQIEWRIAMALSGDKNGLAGLSSGLDAHKDAYARAYGIDYAAVTSGDREYAKIINYGLLYGKGAKSLSEGKAERRGGSNKSKAETAMPIAQVLDYIAKFLATFAQYDAYRKELERQVRVNHFVESAWGRRRYWYTTQNMPEAYNHPISGSAASMMYEALIELDRQLPAGADLRMSVHDEVVVHSTKDSKTLRQALECTRDIMERAFPQIVNASMYPDVVRHYYPNGWNCPTDGHIGMNWRKIKGKSKADKEEEALLRKYLDVEGI